MASTKRLAVKDLSIDLKNFRTVSQTAEVRAINALIAVDTDWYWALMSSLLTDGYLPTENIIVLENGAKLVVKEGNRRISALKIMLGYVRRDQFELPSHIEDAIANLSSAWKKENETVPCAVYKASESAVVDKIVNLTHGKDERAGRAKWKAIARARHNRDMNNGSEPALDLVEAYLPIGKTLTLHQREHWAGEYPITVLDEALKKIAPRIGFKSAPDLVKAYPTIPKYKGAVDRLIFDVGIEDLSFKEIRNSDFALNRYQIPESSSAAQSSTSASSSAAAGQPKGRTTTQPAGTQTKPAKKPKAVAVDDPRAVMAALKSFSPRGKNREKVVTLLEEIRTLKLDTQPHAFCFLMRSMFEISAKAYCTDHAAQGGPAYMKKDGTDRQLTDVLTDVTAHLTKNNSDKQMLRGLHGAITNLAKPNSILSVTSLNQLVHNPKFSVKKDDICSMFGNVFPLLEALN